jgi:chromosome segregation ATPase
LEQNAAEKQAPPSHESRTLEGSLKALWDRVRQAGETIARLRDERTALQARVSELETTVAELERTLGSHRVTIAGLETQLKERPPAADGIISNGEREALAAQVKDLLARMEAYL